MHTGRIRSNCQTLPVCEVSRLRTGQVEIHRLEPIVFDNVLVLHRYSHDLMISCLHINSSNLQPEHSGYFTYTKIVNTYLYNELELAVITLP